MVSAREGERAFHNRIYRSRSIRWRAIVGGEKLLLWSNLLKRFLIELYFLRAYCTTAQGVLSVQRCTFRLCAVHNGHSQCGCRG